jgi:hypothetical protein
MAFLRQILCTFIVNSRPGIFEKLFAFQKCFGSFKLIRMKVHLLYLKKKLSTSRTKYLRIFKRKLYFYIISLSKFYAYHTPSLKNKWIENKQSFFIARMFFLGDADSVTFPRDILSHWHVEPTCAGPTWVPHVSDSLSQGMSPEQCHRIPIPFWAGYKEKINESSFLAGTCVWKEKKRCTHTPPPQLAQERERDVWIGFSGWIGFLRGIMGIMNISYILFVF